MFIVYCRPSAIPGPVPDEIVLPATESIGLFELILMISMQMLFFYVSSESHNPCFLFFIRCKITAEDGMAPRSCN